VTQVRSPTYNSGSDSASGRLSGSFPPHGSERAEAWARRHAVVIAVAIAVAGLALRLLAARGSFVSPDERLHLQIAGAPTLGETYRTSLYNAHPPLFALLLHVWSGIVSGPWALRVLPAVLGAAAIWPAYRFARSAVGEAAGLVALVQLAFLPSVVSVSAELRGYAALLLFSAASLWAVERATADDERARLWPAVALWAAASALALLSHYAAVWVVGAAALYGTIRLGRRALRPAWIAANAFLAAVSAFLWLTQASALRGGALEAEAKATWLAESYYSPGRESAPAFLVRQTEALFAHLYSTRVAGVAALVLALAGVALLLHRRSPVAVLLAAPFAATAAAGLAGLYPYGGTRHSIELVLFAAPAVGVALARATGERVTVALVLALLLLPAAVAVAL